MNFYRFSQTLPELSKRFFGLFACAFALPGGILSFLNFRSLFGSKILCFCLHTSALLSTLLLRLNVRAPIFSNRTDVLVRTYTVYTQQEEDSQDRTSRTGQPEKNSQNRIARVGQPERNIQNGTGRTGQAEHRQNRTGRTERTELDRQNRTGRICQAGMDRQNRTDRTEPAQDCQNRTTRTGQSEQDNRDKTAGQDSKKKQLSRPGQDCQC